MNKIREIRIAQAQTPGQLMHAIYEQKEKEGSMPDEVQYQTSGNANHGQIVYSALLIWR